MCLFKKEDSLFLSLTHLVTLETHLEKDKIVATTSDNFLFSVLFLQISSKPLVVMVLFRVG